jgi:hypothetical protein
MILIILTFFMFYLNTITSKSILLSQSRFELQHNQEIQAFSLLEAKTIHEIVLRMQKYDLDSFELAFESIIVKINILDESVLIEYGLENPVYALLDYDLVFNSSMDYQIIPYETYLDLTKNEISIK